MTSAAAAKQPDPNFTHVLLPPHIFLSFLRSLAEPPRKYRDQPPFAPIELDRHLCDPLIGFPVASADTDAADALTVDHDRNSALHRRPARSPSSQRQSEGMRNIERLTDGALGTGFTFCGRGANRLGAAGVDRVKRSAVHAIKRNDLPSRVHNTAGNRDFCSTRLVNSGRNHLSRTFVGETLRRCYIHRRTTRSLTPPPPCARRPFSPSPPP